MKSSSQNRTQRHRITTRSSAVAFAIGSLTTTLTCLPAALSAPLKTASAQLSDHTRKEELVTLSELHDAGIALARIRQDAINIYVECTRKTITDPGDLEICDPTSIPISARAGTTLPPRKSWLVAYFNSLEPIIQLLNYDVDEAKDEGNLVVTTASPKGQWQPLWVDWANHVKRLNEHLSTMLPLFEEAETNDKGIANEAVSIFNEETWLEKIRKQACKLVVESVP